MAFAGWVLGLALTHIQERARRRAELQVRVLDRFGSAAEFMEFLDSEPGRRFQEALSGRRGGLTRVLLGAVQAGVVMLFLGAGLSLAYVMMRGDEGVLLS